CFFMSALVCDRDCFISRGRKPLSRRDLAENDIRGYALRIHRPIIRLAFLPAVSQRVALLQKALLRLLLLPIYLFAVREFPAVPDPARTQARMPSAGASHLHDAARRRDPAGLAFRRFVWPYFRLFLPWQADPRHCWRSQTIYRILRHRA